SLSTRKLVYDPGASEEAVKSLMQSQHKAALRDLKGGTFDDKIDLYLVGTPGLMPRGAEEGVSTRAPTQDDSGPTSISRAATESLRDRGERSTSTPGARGPPMTLTPGDAAAP